MEICYIWNIGIRIPYGQQEFEEKNTLLHFLFEIFSRKNRKRKIESTQKKNHIRNISKRHIHEKWHIECLAAILGYSVRTFRIAENISTKIAADNKNFFFPKTKIDSTHTAPACHGIIKFISLEKKNPKNIFSRRRKKAYPSNDYSLGKVHYIL